MFSLSLSGCAEDVAPARGDIVKFPAANLKNDTYSPGGGWQLVWSWANIFFNKKRKKVIYDYQ